jgi:glycosyltransferase involved in cell wall biosynthesis
MFYIPRVLKQLDGRWLKRAIGDQLRAIHTARHAHLIDAHFGYPDGVACVRAAREMGIPAVVTIRGVENELLEEPAIGPQLKHALSEADGIICVSHSLSKRLKSEGLEPAKVCVIHNAIDRSRFSVGCKYAARDALGVARDVPIVVAVGHLIHRKRHHVLVDAFNRFVRAQHPEALLVIIGSPHQEPGYAQNLAAGIAARGLNGSVRLLGNQHPEIVSRWLQAADVFALLTAREGCCNSILEALACGTPVVTTRVGDNAEFVEPTRNGALVDVDDAEESGAAIVSLLQDRQIDRKSISASLDVGDWDSVAIAVDTFFRRVTGVSNQQVTMRSATG